MNLMNFRSCRSRQQPSSGGLWAQLLAAYVVLLLCLVTPTQAQDDRPLYAREPFDRITLDQANRSAVIDVFPITSLSAGVPESFTGQTLQIRRLTDPPEIRYAVTGKNIVAVERFQDLLVKAVSQSIESNRMDQAFQLLARLRDVAPDFSELAALEEVFFFADTRQQFREKRYDESLLSLDEVFRRNPKRSGLDRALNGILSQMFLQEFTDENYRSIRSKLEFAKRKYGSTSEALVQQWEKRLQAKAREQFALAQASFEQEDSTTALIAIRRASETWPEMNGLETLKRAILTKFPRLRVGVSQSLTPPSTTHDSSTILNWAVRRSEPLIRNPMVRLAQFTVDGGQYQSELGQITVAPDRQSVKIRLSPELSSSVHRINHQLLQLADSHQPAFSPRWAEYTKAIYPQKNSIQIQLTRGSLRPESLLPRMLRSVAVDDLTQGPFQLQTGTDAQTQVYARRPGSNPDANIVEIGENLFEDPTAACTALTDGRVDLVDRIYPGDYDNLSRNNAIRLVPYRLPTIHGLVFNDRVPLLRNATYRRGLLYGIDRQTFVDQELNGAKKQNGQVLSGFAPIGRSENDPLGYAYNFRIRPRAYDPSLASILMRLAMRSESAPANPDSESQSPEAESTNADGVTAVDTADNEPPVTSPPPITLAYPDSHLASSACEAIAANWRRLGIEVNLRILPSGAAIPTDQDWDALYLEATIEEPMSDLPQLVLGHRILGRHGGLVWHAMRQLQDSESLEEVRNQFAKIHRLTFDHTPILPLWQVIEHAAIPDALRGVGESPITLYQDLEKWSLTR